MRFFGVGGLVSHRGDGSLPAAAAQGAQLLQLGGARGHRHWRLPVGLPRSAGTHGGFQVETMDECVGEADFITLGIGNFMKKMKSNALVAYSGRFDEEIDMAVDEGTVDIKVENVKPQVEVYVGGALAVCGVLAGRGLQALCYLGRPDDGLPDLCRRQRAPQRPGGPRGDPVPGRLGRVFWPPSWCQAGHL